MQAALRRAQELEKAGRSSEAIQTYRQVLDSDPKCLRALVGLGRSYYVSGEFAQASANFEKGLQLRPADPEILNWLGRSYLRERRPEKVLELLSREGSSSSNSASIHMLRARAYDAQDKLEEAIQEIQRALELDPHFHGAHFALGFIAWSTGNMASAEKELQQELRLDPHERLAAYYLAEVLEKRGKFSEADAVLTEMEHDAPNTYLYHLAAGKAQERKKNYRLAAEHYQEAIRLDPKQPEAHYRLGLAQTALGEHAKAKEEFAVFTQLHSQTEGGVGHGMGRMRPHLPDFH